MPAELPTIVSLQDFANLFPKSVRASPQIKSLYRDLQHQRNLTIDRVKQNIDAEVKASVRMRKELIKMKRAEHTMDGDDEMEIERAVWPSPHLILMFPDDEQKLTMNSFLVHRAPEALRTPSTPSSPSCPTWILPCKTLRPRSRRWRRKNRSS